MLGLPPALCFPVWTCSFQGRSWRVQGLLPRRPSPHLLGGILPRSGPLWWDPLSLQGGRADVPGEGGSCSSSRGSGGLVSRQVVRICLSPWQRRRLRGRAGVLQQDKFLWCTNVRVHSKWIFFHSAGFYPYCHFLPKIWTLTWHYNVDFFRLTDCFGVKLRPDNNMQDWFEPALERSVRGGKQSRSREHITVLYALTYVFIRHYQHNIQCDILPIKVCTLVRLLKLSCLYDRVGAKNLNFPILFPQINKNSPILFP